MTYILVLDIGGTNPRMAIMEIISFEHYTIIKEQALDTSIPSLSQQINTFLSKCAKEQIMTNTCCVGFAGPVRENKYADPTNVKFTINADEIKNDFITNVLVINDFEAIGHGVAGNTTKCITLSTKSNPTPDENGVKAVIGPGTGLGVCSITKSQNGIYDIHASEGGHASLGLNSMYASLYRFLEKKYNITKIATETLVSGQGIQSIIEFLVQQPDIYEHLIRLKHFSDIPIRCAKQTTHISDDDLARIIEQDDSDVAKFVGTHAQQNPKALLTMKLFMEFLGEAAQDIAVTFMPTGGLYIAGGIVPKNIDVLQEGDFSRGFYDNWKGNLRDLLHKIPIYVVTDYNISFYGCARAAQVHFGNSIE